MATIFLEVLVARGEEKGKLKHKRLNAFLCPADKY
jgi:hypothetical protein